MDYKPLQINSSEAKDLAEEKNSAVIDLLPSQAKELFDIHHIKEIEDKNKIELLPEFKKFALKKKDSALLFYYPWLNRIINTVGEEDFFILKTNRNRDLITLEEQKKLKDFTVAVFGLSVGSNIAFLLCQAGISNKIFLADPDILDTSNLNRLLTGVQDLGLNKAVISCRKITEANPYADPVALEKGIDEKLLESLLQNEKINCIVEEVDSLPVKISTRKLAMKYKVPVLMITDNGFSVVLHLERYDLGYDQIFEKEAAYWDKKFNKELTHDEVSRIIIEDIFGSMDKIDPKLFASNLKIMKKELVSWPQLGSTAMLGGTAATQAIIKLALEESRQLFIKKFYSIDI